MPQIQYSEKYYDDTYEYRHVVLPPDVAKLLPKNRLLSEDLGFDLMTKLELNLGFANQPTQGLTWHVNTLPISKQSEWRAIGVQQSRGWVHYAIHRPEPHIMLFRRPLNYQQNQQQQAQQQSAQPMGLQA